MYYLETVIFQADKYRSKKLKEHINHRLDLDE